MAESKEKFPKRLEDWFKNHYPEYDAKLGVSKPHSLGQPEHQDDNNLKKWKAERCNIFETTFKEELGVLIENAPPTAVQLPPILIVDHPSRSDGRRLFEELNTEEFSKQATARREAQGQSSQHHAGHWQAIASAAWKALTDDERDCLEQKAKVARSGSAEEGGIYENQKTVGLSLFQFLKTYAGTGSRQIGNVAFHLLYGFRGKYDQLELGSIEISDHDFFDEKFSTFVGEYDDIVGGPWRKYCEKAIGSNCVVNYEAKFNKSSAGWFILPEFDEENGTNSALRSSLKDFLEASWDQIWPRSSDMPILPWNVVLDHPTDFFNPLLSIETILGRPESMRASALRDLSAAIVRFQTSPQTLGFSIFRLKSELAHGVQMRGAVVEENFDITALPISSLPPQDQMPSVPIPQVFPASDSASTETIMSISMPSSASSSTHLSSEPSSVATTIAASESSLPSIAGSLEPCTSPIPSRSAPSQSPVPEVTAPGNFTLSNSNLSMAVDSSTNDELPMTADTPKPTQKRKRNHKPELNLVDKNLPTGPRSRKPSKRARGLGYEELTTSDEERQLGKISKKARKRRAK